MTLDKNSHIIIIGDSYSIGEWQKFGLPHEQVPHNGVAEYFHQDGFRVTNLGMPGGALDWMIYPLENFLLANQYTDNKKIIVFQTDISRNLGVPGGDINLESYNHWKNIVESNSAFSVSEILDLLYLDFYQKLDAATRNHDVEFFLVGGVTDITVDVSNLDRFTVAVPSMIQLMDRSIPSNLRLLSGQWEVIDKLFSSRKEELIILMDQQEERNVFLKTHREWFPDNFHPNREVHKLCYEKIKESLV